jgi:tetratricopeptide (TPR) repeat protein
VIPARLNLMRSQQSFWIAAILARFALVATFLWAALGVPRSDAIMRSLLSGDKAARQGRYAAALDAYARVLYEAEPQPAIYERLVQVSLDAGRYDDAQVYLYALADLDGWNPERRDQLRIVFERNGEAARANALLYASVGDSPLDARVLRSLAQQQINGLEWDQAESTLGQLLALDPGDKQALYQLALLLAPVDQGYAREYLGRIVSDPIWAVRAETVHAALSVYDTASLTDAHTYLGVTLIGLGEWPFAERALQMALEANAVNPTALAYLGFARDQQGRDGLPDLQAALAMAPNEPIVYYLLGQHWRQAGRRDDEYEAFTRAYFLSPNNPALAVEVGIALQNQSDLAGAEAWFRRAIELDPGDIHWRRVLAAFYADTGFQLDTTGLAFIEESSQLTPDDPDIRASLGWAYYQTHESQRAYVELSAAVGLDPENPRSRYYFGVVLERRGDKQGAADSYWFVVDQIGPDTGFGLLAARALQRLGYAP